MGIFSRSNQGYPSHVSTERYAEGGLLLGVLPESTDGRQVYTGLCVDRGVTSLVVGKEGGGVALFGGHHSQGSRQSPK